MTELGIDIINLAVADPILPIKKPNFPSPGDHPVHFPARHKALPPTFPRPVRYATWKNILGVSSAQAIKAAKETCQGMRDRDIQLLKQQVLRYKRKTDVLKLSHFRPGLSFRGRGELEKAKEWKVIESVTSTDEQILPVLSVIPQTSSATKPEKSLGSLVIITGQSVTRSLESTLIGAVGESTIKSLDNHSPDRSKMAVTNMEKETPLGTVFSLSPASSSEMRVSESAGASQKDPKSVSMTEHLVSTASPNVSSQPTMNLSNCSSLVSPSMEIPLLPADKAESEPALANGKMHSSPLKETDSPIESLNSACTSQGSVDAQWIEEQKKELFGERRIDESSVPSLFEKKTRRKSSRKTSFTSDPLQKPIPRHFHTSARIERDESDLFANELLHSMLKSASEETRPQEAVAVPLVKTRTSLQDSSAPVSLRNSNSNTRVGHSEKADAAVESLEAPDVSSSLIKSADLSPGPLPGETVNSESLVFSYEGAIAQILANENIETHSRCYSELGPSSCEDLELSHSRSRSMQSISNLSASSKKDKKKGSSLIVKSFSKSIEKLNYVIEKRKRNSDGLSTNRASFEQLLHDAQSISVSRPSITKTESFMEIMSSKSREVTEHQTISSSSLQPIQLEDTPYALAIDEALKSMSEEPREEPYSIIDSHNANNLSGNNPEEKTSEDDLMEYLHRNRSGPIDPSADLIPHELTTNDIIESETVMVKDQSQKNPLETLVESTNIPEAPLFLSTLDKQRIMTPLVVDISSPELIYNQTETSNVGTDFHPVTDAAASDTVQTLTQVSYPAPADPTQDTKVSLIAPRTHIISPEFIVSRLYI